MPIQSVSALDITSVALSKAQREEKVSTSNLNKLIKNIKSLNNETIGGDLKKAMENLRALNGILNRQDSHVINKKSERIILAGELIVNKSLNKWNATQNIASNIQKNQALLDQANSVLNGRGIAGSHSRVFEAWNNKKDDAEVNLLNLNKVADKAARETAKKLIQSD